MRRTRRRLRLAGIRRIQLAGRRIRTTIDPPLNEEAIEGLKAEFQSSLERVFAYTELSASVIQDKLGLNALVDLLQTWDSDAALESACNNLIRGANNYAVDDEVPVFQFSMLQDLILYREWVCLRLSRGLSAESEFFTRKQRIFMNNWQRALRDIKESIRLSAKSESNILKFNAKDWLKWFKSIDNYFRCTLGVRGVTLYWIYREEAYPKASLKYPSIAAELKAMLLLEGAHFDEDSRAIYDVIASSTLGTTSYAYIKKFEESRNGWLALLALKLQFGGEAYDLAWSNAANEVIRSATFTSPTRKYTHDQHVAKYKDAYNELALLSEPVLEASKVRLFCKSLKEKFMKASAIDTQMNKETASSFEKAMAHLKSVRNLHVADGANKDEWHVSGRRRAAAPEAPAVSNFTAIAMRSGALSPRPPRPRSTWGALLRRLLREPRPQLHQPSRMKRKRKPRKAASSSERALTPESKIGRPRQSNCLSRLSCRILLQDPIHPQGCLQ
jgi:hypothetical protein